MTAVGMRAAEQTDLALTVAVPAYGNWDHLRICIESLTSQSVRDFEILISEDAAPEDGTKEVLAQLEESGRPFQLYRQQSNLGYDGNVRFCLGAAKGRHVMLLGHDDALATPDEVRHIQLSLEELGFPEVAFTSFEDWATGTQTVRAPATASLGSGVGVALRHFRTFSFVGGLLFDREAVARHDTPLWDGSIYVQIYLACRILAAGGRLGAIGRSSVRKDIRVDDRTVETYATRVTAGPRSIGSRHTGLDMVLQVTADAVTPFVGPPERSRVVRRIAIEILAVPYLYWLFEYRRLGGLPAGLGIARGMTLPRFLGSVRISPIDRACLWVLYGGVTAAGLFLPATLLRGALERAASANRLRRQRR